MSPKVKRRSGIVSTGAAAASHDVQSRLFSEQHFRWRGREITRLEAFSDVVFGFAITLLVVSLEVPHSYAELLTDIRGFLPFGICFALLVMIWHSHYRFSRRYALEDSYSVFLNVLLLFVVLFYVYPLKFLFSLLLGGLTGSASLHDVGLNEAAVLMQIYGIGFACVFGLFALLYAHAYRLREALELTPLEQHVTRVSLQANIIMMSVGLLSCTLAFWNPGWAGWSYFVITPLRWIHSAIAGKRSKLLALRVDSD